MEECPFKVGDIVIYKPTVRGRGLVAMTDLAKLEPGKKYKVARIDEGISVVVEGFEDSPGGGLYWTEFAPASS
jgi:hypothetical protein